MRVLTGKRIFPLPIRNKNDMKHALSLVLVFCWCVTLCAQDAEPVLLRLFYIETFKAYEENQELRTEEMVLDIGKGSSCFYSRWFAARRHYVDSLLARGGDENTVLQAMGKFPSSNRSYTVHKEYPRKGMLTCTDRVLKDFVYEEPEETPEWTLLAQDTVIMGYKCHAAACSFRGRTWRAFYAVDIPVNDGPWKLHGLPGVILWAKDGTGIFSFECIGIEDGGGKTMFVPNLKKHIKCTREELMKLHRESAQDPNKFVAKFGYVIGQGYGADGRPLVYKPKTPLFLDY